MALLVPVAVSIAGELQGQVVDVADGDTVTVLDYEYTQHRVRLAGIDAPEKAQAFGDAARASLAELVFNRLVVVRWEKVDRYGRIVGVVTLDGKDMNFLQIERGLAWHYKAYEREQSADEARRYAEAEDRARAARAGLWSDPTPLPPWDWRKQKRGD